MVMPLKDENLFGITREKADKLHRTCQKEELILLLGVMPTGIGFALPVIASTNIAGRALGAESFLSSEAIKRFFEAGIPLLVLGILIFVAGYYADKKHQSDDPEYALYSKALDLQHAKMFHESAYDFQKAGAKKQCDDLQKKCEELRDELARGQSPTADSLQIQTHVK